MGDDRKIAATAAYPVILGAHDHTPINEVSPAPLTIRTVLTALAYAALWMSEFTSRPPDRPQPGD